MFRRRLRSASGSRSATPSPSSEARWDAACRSSAPPSTESPGETVRGSVRRTAGRATTGPGRPTAAARARSCSSSWRSAPRWPPPRWFRCWKGSSPRRRSSHSRGRVSLCRRSLLRRVPPRRRGAERGVGMSPLAERALFFGTGLLFGVVLGFLVGGGPEAPAAPSREASSPLREEAGPREAVSPRMGPGRRRRGRWTRTGWRRCWPPSRPVPKTRRAGGGGRALPGGGRVLRCRLLAPAGAEPGRDRPRPPQSAGVRPVRPRRCPGRRRRYEEVLAEDPDHFESLLASAASDSSWNRISPPASRSGSARSPRPRTPRSPRPPRGDRSPPPGPPPVAGSGGGRRHLRRLPIPAIWRRHRRYTGHIGDSVAIITGKMALTPRVFAPPVGSYFLFGPRGTGRPPGCGPPSGRAGGGSPRPRPLPDTLGASRGFSGSRPRRRSPQFPARRHNGSGGDEVQRAPELLPVVHGLIESELPVRFALTGSSARKLRRGGVNLLGGRAADCRLHPFMAAELGDAFNLDAALRRGLLPLVVADADPESRLRSFSALYLDQEVRAEGLARDIGAFARFLEAMTFSQGAALNLSAVAARWRLGSARSRDMWRYWRICCSPSGSRCSASAPDAASRPIRSSSISTAASFAPSDRRVPSTARRRSGGGARRAGRAAPPRLCRLSRPGRPPLHLADPLRPRNRFRLLRPGGFLGGRGQERGEGSPGGPPRPRSFGDEYPEARRLLLYRGEHRLFTGGILCLPVADFLRRLHPAPLPGGGRGPGRGRPAPRLTAPELPGSAPPGARRSRPAFAPARRRVFVCSGRPSTSRASAKSKKQATSPLKTGVRQTNTTGESSAGEVSALDRSTCHPVFGRAVLRRFHRIRGRGAGARGFGEHPPRPRVRRRDSDLGGRLRGPRRRTRCRGRRGFRGRERRYGARQGSGERSSHAATTIAEARIPVPRRKVDFDRPRAAALPPGCAVVVEPGGPPAGRSAAAPPPPSIPAPAPEGCFYGW